MGLLRSEPVILLAKAKPEKLGKIVVRITNRLISPSAGHRYTCPGGECGANCTTAKHRRQEGNLVWQPCSLLAGVRSRTSTGPTALYSAPSNEAVQALKQIFSDLVMRGVPVIVSNYETAELVRELATGSITTKISFINELATLCEHVNANAVHLASSISIALGS